jgi:uncharacterized protein (TIGR03067 family)
MKTKRLFSLLLFCAAALTACKKDEGPPDAPAEVQGTWSGYEVLGRSGTWTLIIAGRALSTSGPGEWAKGSVNANPAANPKEVNFVINEASLPQYVGKTSLGIYKISNDTLTVALNAPGVTRRAVSFRVDLENRVFVFRKQ